MNKRVILITGANGGLGHAIARAFLAENNENVIWLGVHSRRDQAETLVSEQPQRCRWCNLDVTNRASWDRTAAEVLAKDGRLDVLINNAGCHEDALLGTMPPESWDRVLATNLDGVFHGC